MKSCPTTRKFEFQICQNRFPKFVSNCCKFSQVQNRQNLSFKSVEKFPKFYTSSFFSVQRSYRTVIKSSVVLDLPSLSFTRWAQNLDLRNSEIEFLDCLLTNGFFFRKRSLSGLSLFFEKGRPFEKRSTFALKLKIEFQIYTKTRLSRCHIWISKTFLFKLLKSRSQTGKFQVTALEMSWKIAVSRINLSQNIPYFTLWVVVLLKQTHAGGAICLELDLYFSAQVNLNVKKSSMF